MNEPTLEPLHAEDPRIGTVLAERYRVVRKLGQGGMGIVYEGVHTVIGRRVAIKMLHGQFATNDDVVARFHREAVAATAIGHPHIVEVIDMARAPDGAVFMVLEFLDGRDWAHDLDATGPQSLGRVVKILAPVLDALAAAHAKKIVHRDLKPENVFLVSRADDPDFVKLVDFGISKMLDEPSTTGKGLTQTGAAMGTPYYMAPEQMAGRKDIDHRADLYSVGVMLYQAITGAYPFDGDTIAMLALKVMSTEPPPLSQYLGEVPDGLQSVIDRALAKDPANRFASAAELRDALAQWRDDVRPASALRRARAELATMPAVAVMPTRAVDTREMPGQSLEPAPRPRAGMAPLVIGTLVTGMLGLAVLAYARGEPDGAPIASAATALDDGDRVHIVIATVPADADLRIDGLVVANPFDGELPRSRDEHHVEARADGHAPTEREVTLLTDQHITLTLAPMRADEPPPTTTIAAPPTTHRPARPPTTPVPTLAVAPPSVVIAPPPDPPPPPHDEPARPSDQLLRPF